jgi:hypothetical protein
LILLISASCVARNTDVSHWHPAGVTLKSWIALSGSLWHLRSPRTDLRNECPSPSKKPNLSPAW